MNTIGFTINGGTELERHLFCMSEEELNIDVQYSGISSQELLDRFTEADKPDWDVLSELVSAIDGLDDFMLFNAIEDEREENERDDIRTV